MAIALVASVSTAVAMLGLHRLKEVDARAVVAHFSGLASLTIGLVLLFLRPASASFAALDGRTWALLLGVGLSGTLGQVFLTKAYASGPPAKIAVLSLTQVAFGLGFDLLLYGRELTLPSVLGFLMVVGPTAWVTSRAARRPRPHPDAGTGPRPGGSQGDRPILEVAPVDGRVAT